MKGRYKKIEKISTLMPTYMLHVVEGIQDMSLEELAKHAKMKPEEARGILVELVKSIPDEDLKGLVGAQVTVMT